MGKRKEKLSSRPGSGNVGDLVGESDDQGVSLADVLPGFVDKMTDSIDFEEALYRAVERRGGTDRFLDVFMRKPDPITLDKLAKVLVEAEARKRMSRRRAVLKARNKK
jgi:hypothetical protein